LGPGTTGIGNTMSPKYVNLSKIVDIDPKPPVIWFRGIEDKIVSDNSYSDVGLLGKLRILPGWPGDEVYPPQPMVSQTRNVFEKYRDNGGEFKEIIFEKSGHSPQIEEPEKFVLEYETFLNHL
ncbi:MAG TPA: alpha/beta hydrolase, partial [Clostridiaceae bacterium]|nr:alpha/beta hydrolase [Clostridiaceae bacterium]